MIHLDGLGYNYLQKSNLTFINSLKGYLYRMRINFGYFGNEVSLFTGMTPKQHKMEDIFILNPEKVPFKSKFIFNLIPKKLLRYASFFYGYQTYININLPKNYFKKFVPISQGHPQTFKDSFATTLGAYGIQFKYIPSHHFNLSDIKSCIKKNDVVYAMNLTYDHLLHKHGTNFIKNTGVDNVIKKLYKFLVKNYKEDFYLILLSDHGMMDVTGKIDALYNHLTDNKLYFVDSTILRMWSTQDTSLSMDNIELKESQQIDSYGYKYYKKYLAKPGYIFSPNFFQGNKSIKGMHGYNSTNSDHDAFILIHHPQFRVKNKRYCSIIDVAPTILSIFKIKKPSFMEGNSLI